MEKSKLTCSNCNKPSAMLLAKAFDGFLDYCEHCGLYRCVDTSDIDCWKSKEYMEVNDGTNR